ncbi:hypothetical protein JYG23_03170 [Sedimentibacter sp. zth1]|uniref:hypothetical protein n=1 Tax=Sedimentibacter sp. zth1 TaxID=2816908 RepID=UPI001A918DBA|nr:hypothetical protein [Sedimentibacter sp. zth1]QSX06474.1 hypothetical protein JYG23_03170 [Sedimentibacter sp. zth1]
MTKIKKIITLGTVLLVVGATSMTAFAASNYKTPADVVAGLTGKTVEAVIEAKQETGKTYGTLANDAGKLEEFKKENIEIKKDILEEKVADGILTQEKADEIINAIVENQANCDGTGSAKIGQEYGIGFGKGNGHGMRNGEGQGKRMGNSKGSCFSE